ncbi:HAMP domain-containing histidine kinase [Actinomadura sp. GC306]|nr:HAMP domain-containing histidine kinase [Actinomadura sp. GC306]
MSSVRAQTTVGATAVVAGALIVAGLAVVLLLRANLAGKTDLEAEVTARNVASQLASGARYGDLELPDAREHPVQVTDEDGRVLAASRGLEAISGTGSPDVRPAPPAAQRGDDDDDDDDDDLGPGEVSDDAPRLSDGRATVGGSSADYRFAAVEATTPRDETVIVHAGSDLSVTQDAVGTAARAMLVGLPLLLAVVAGVTWLVTGRALRPVEAVRAELAEITAAGDLFRRVPVPDSGDEIADLAATTNETLARLQDSAARQRGFVADASHELRSPIASLRTQLEVAAAHPELLDMDGLVEDVVRLQHLAADLLLLARIDAGERPPRETVALGTLVRDEVTHRAASGRVPPRSSIEADPAVTGVPRQLSRVVGNLLDNAGRHADQVVRLSLREEAGQAVIQVADDGPGVPPGDRDRIFQRFVRLDDARSRDEGGSGLGLAIARDLVVAHGGSITVGEAPEGGALFEVRLPVSGGAGGR